MTIEIAKPFAAVANDVFEEYMNWDNVEYELAVSEVIAEAEAITIQASYAAI